MVSKRILLRSLVEVREYVDQTLCQLNELERGVFEMTERTLTRAREACGVFFCLYGPRRVRLTAIWEMDNNTIRFYDSAGDRVQTIQLIAPNQSRIGAS